LLARSPGWHTHRNERISAPHAFFPDGRTGLTPIRVTSPWTVSRDQIPTRATRDVSCSRAACRLCDTALYGRFIWHSGGGDQCGGLGWGCCGEHLSSGTRQVLHPSPSSRDHSGGWGAVIGNHHSLIILYILRPVCLAPSSFDNRGGGLSFRPNLFLYLKNMQTVVTPLTPRMFDRERTNVRPEHC
jgi:hypothetical protein